MHTAVFLFYFLAIFVWCWSPYINYYDVGTTNNNTSNIDRTYHSLNLFEATSASV